jgi:Ribbon-helix-helix protein, copG family
MSPTMNKTTIYLDDATRLSLRRAAQREGKTQAEILRDAVKRYEGATHEGLPPGAGEFHSGRRDVGGRAEALLRAATRKRKWR